MLTINPNLPAILAVCLLSTSAMAKTEIPVTCNLPRYGLDQFPELSRSSQRLGSKHAIISSGIKLNRSPFPSGVILSNPDPKESGISWPQISRVWYWDVRTRSKGPLTFYLGPYGSPVLRTAEILPLYWNAQLLLQLQPKPLFVGDAMESKDLDVLRGSKLEDSLQALVRDRAKGEQTVRIELQIHQLSARAGDELATKLMKAGFANCKTTAWNTVTGTLPVKSLDGIIQLTSIQSIRLLRSD